MKGAQVRENLQRGFKSVNKLPPPLFSDIFHLFLINYFGEAINYICTKRNCKRRLLSTHSNIIIKLVEVESK